MSINSISYTFENSWNTKIMIFNDKKNLDISEIDLDAWSKELGSSVEQVRFCISRVGTSWVSVEAYWEMNKYRLEKAIPKDN